MATMHIPVSMMRCIDILLELSEKIKKKEDELAFTRPAGFAAGKNGRSESVKATGKPDRPENASAEGDGEDERSVAEDDYVADGRQFDGHVR